MPAVAQPRPYPLDALLHYLRVNPDCPGERGCPHAGCDHRTLYGWFSPWATISGRDLVKARREGLTEVQADRLAVRAGVHPALIWPTWFENAPVEAAA